MHLRHSLRKLELALHDFGVSVRSRNVTNIVHLFLGLQSEKWQHQVVILVSYLIRHAMKM